MKVRNTKCTILSGALLQNPRLGPSLLPPQPNPRDPLRPRNCPPISGPPQTFYFPYSGCGRRHRPSRRDLVARRDGTGKIVRFAFCWGALPRDAATPRLAWSRHSMRSPAAGPAAPAETHSLYACGASFSPSLPFFFERGRASKSYLRERTGEEGVQEMGMLSRNMRYPTGSSQSIPSKLEELGSATSFNFAFGLTRI